MNTNTKNGRYPMSPVLKSVKSLASAYDALNKIKIEMELALGLDGSEKDKEIIAIKEQRMDLNKELSPILERLFPLSRKKDLTKEERAELNILQKKKRALHKELFEMPKIGMTESDWAQEFEALKKIKTHGRPTKSVELRMIHAQIEFDACEKKYRDIESLPENESAILDIFEDKAPISLEKIHKIGFKEDRSKKAGRPSAGRVTQVEKDLRIIRKKIVKILSSKKEKSDEKNNQNSVVGRPAKSRSAKLEMLREQEQELVKKVEKIESKMTDIEIVNRKIVSYRKEVRAKKEIVESKGLDEKEDIYHPDILEYNRMNYVLAMFISRRTALTKEIEIKEAFKTHESKKVVNNNVVDKKENKQNQLSDDLKEKIRALKLGAMKMEQAKLIKDRILSQKKLEESKDDSLDSETEALKSIV